MIGGSGFNHWVIQKNPLMKVKLAASKVGCPLSNTTEIVACLRTKPADQLTVLIKLFQVNIL
jgi:hypothetical protein